MKPFVGRVSRVTRPLDPNPHRRLLIEARRISFESQKLDEMSIFPKTKSSRDVKSTPQPLPKKSGVCQFRLFAYQILPHPLDKTFRVDIGKRRHLFRSQLNHPNAL
ncbi:hypothetical protein GGD40_000952 [Paraburkholderia bryophila]|uniref:Uncharacterized protein n=1 Tax=Paraburkholderia bryophila TaxID=420952 RepID=A0A7Y9WKJ9_9BURK|nr:hypothetical protein [Paraburkholderia bryophila]